MSNRVLSDKDLIELFKIFKDKEFSLRELSKQFRVPIPVIIQAINNFDKYSKKGV